MSSDLSSGKNKKFTKESVYIMLSEKLGKLFYQKTAYNDAYVKIKNDAKMYDKNKKVIGTIYKDTELELESYKDITKKDKYFKVKDNDYYVYYKDIKKVKKFLQLIMTILKKNVQII